MTTGATVATSATALVPVPAVPPAVAAALAALEPDPSGRAALAANHYLAGLAPSSRRPQREALDTVAALLTAGRCETLTLPWHRLTALHTGHARAALVAATVTDRHGATGPRFAPATINRHLAALRGVLKACWRLDYLDEPTYTKAIDLKAASGTRPRRGRAVPGDELARLFGVCAADPRPAGARDAALLAVLYSCGLRRSEAVALQTEHYDAAAGTLLVAHGKGDQSRLCHPTPTAVGWLERWLRLRGPQPGPIFVPVDRFGQVQPVRALTDGSVRTILIKRAKQAGVEAPAPHDLRRSFISDLLDHGVDTILAQALAGHASPTTTARYDRRGEAAKRRAAHTLVVPDAPDD